LYHYTDYLEGGVQVKGIGLRQSSPGGSIGLWYGEIGLDHRLRYRFAKTGDVYAGLNLGYWFYFHSIRDRIDRHRYYYDLQIGVSRILSGNRRVSLNLGTERLYGRLNDYNNDSHSIRIWHAGLDFSIYPFQKQKRRAASSER
jgi:hypothetical protein